MSKINVLTYYKDEAFGLAKKKRKRKEKSIWLNNSESALV